MKTPVLALAAGTVFIGSLGADTATVQIKEWPVPWEASRPRDPFVDQQGRVWFVGQRTHYAAYLDPTTGEFERFDLGEGTGPHNLIVDPEGIVWFTGNAASHIGKLNPATGEITRIPMPDPAVRDPHTLVLDQSGTIWFTAQFSNHVGKLDRATGEVRLIPVPTPNSRPYGIVVDRQGRPWFNEFGANKIGMIDPTTLELKEYTLPYPNARGRRIAATSDGAVWYADYARGSIGRLDPASGEVKEWPSPGGSRSQPYGMALDSSERIWVVETGSNPNRLVGFDPRTEQYFSVTEIPSGGGAVRHMSYHEPTGSIWFGTDTNTIGQAVVETD